MNAWYNTKYISAESSFVAWCKMVSIWGDTSVTRWSVKEYSMSLLDMLYLWMWTHFACEHTCKHVQNPNKHVARHMDRRKNREGPIWNCAVSRGRGCKATPALFPATSFSVFLLPLRWPMQTTYKFSLAAPSYTKCGHYSICVKEASSCQWNCSSNDVRFNTSSSTPHVQIPWWFHYTGNFPAPVNRWATLTYLRIAAIFVALRTSPSELSRVTKKCRLVEIYQYTNEIKYTKTAFSLFPTHDACEH